MSTNLVRRMLLVNKHIMSYKVQDGAAEYKACVMLLFTLSSKTQQYGPFQKYCFVLLIVL
ncbi:hypothetical protein HanRHA438_Chr13g0628211 [Helianthus annuus]|nr:hypothetical protein HanRHA438_Chr13g0628211 [Helianthus annuus]